MDMMEICPECGAAWRGGITCEQHFHQMLFWEAENPEYGIVHHLMVLCYHLQHPSLYSPDGLDTAKRLLTDFLVRGLTPAEVRRDNRHAVDSGNRAWKIKGTPNSRGSYQHPIQWQMTAADVIASDADHYCESVKAWAWSIYETLQASANL
jgi:hypothetical protein